MSWSNMFSQAGFFVPGSQVNVTSGTRLHCMTTGVDNEGISHFQHEGNWFSQVEKTVRSQLLCKKSSLLDG